MIFKLPAHRKKQVILDKRNTYTLDIYVDNLTVHKGLTFSEMSVLLQTKH